MKVKELIEILSKCNPESCIGTFANGHWNDSSAYRSHGGISVVLRKKDVIIGNFNGYGLPTKLPYSDQFRDIITKWYKDSQHN